MNALELSAGFAENIAPNDGANLPMETMGIEVTGSAGNIHAICGDGQEKTWAVMAGHQYAVRLIKVFSTNTTATGLVGYYPYKKRLPP